jgi:hypothetical protein
MGNGLLVDVQTQLDPYSRVRKVKDQRQRGMPRAFPVIAKSRPMMFVVYCVNILPIIYGKSCVAVFQFTSDLHKTRSPIQSDSYQRLY